jgi:glucose-6-phosphate isomerase
MHDTTRKAPFTHDVEACFHGRQALPPADYKAALAATRPALERLRQQRQDGSLPLLQLPAKRDDLPVFQQAVDRCLKCDNVVFLGTGGSSLGGRTLAALADGGFGPAADPRGKPRLWFLENVDPDGFERAIGGLDPARTAAVIVSKSGGTAETLSQALALLPRLKAAGDNLPARVTVITEPTDNPLRRLAQRHSLPLIDHDPKVGGRFSVLSPTGILPAMIAGLDAVKIREGAGRALDEALADNPAQSQPAVGAAINFGLQRHRGISQTVMMPYVDRLAPFAAWFVQLWAESLGKQGKGTTPIRALGTVDQHSQLQLYLAGPADKMFTIVMGNTRDRGPRYTREDLGDKALDWLAGRTLGDLLDVSQRATADTLVRNGRPVRVIKLGTLDEYCLGALLMHFMLETIIAAELWKVDPFDQPAVEEGKVLARQYLKEMSA